jgi:hypothetical protein
VLAAAAASCASPPPESRPLPPNSFAFAIFGDGPYYWSERRRFALLIDDINRADVEWLVHVGDIMWGRCSDEALASRLEALKQIRHPVVYTPGDNEWTDCHQRGGFRPLERLERIRRTYFSDPSESIAGDMSVESQSENPAWKEFVENVRWRRGGFLFVTAHMVGSFNATRNFRGRSPADDSAVVRRTAAALEWLRSAFAIAEAESLAGVVVAMHANPHFQDSTDNPFSSFMTSVERLTGAFRGHVLLIHGDTHEYTVDHPLPLQNFTRLETYGSPDIGWVRVVIDSVAGRITAIEPRLID